ncbi:MAG: hypothetical protein IJR13_02870 [Bacteroidales bacterium]|nr:hypothetical protein [Bacteroidales bacterium]
MSVATCNTADEVCQLLPQRPPILMLDSFEYVDGSMCRGTVMLTEKMVFADDDGTLVQEAVLEHIAQCAAAFMGYRRKMMGQEVALGFIGDIKRCTFMNLELHVGDRIESELQTVSEVGSVLMVSATARLDNGQTVSRCTMKLASA